MQQQTSMPPFSPAAVPSPISSRPPEVDAPPASAGSFVDGDEGDRSGGSAGNRWPRQETLALLKIRSEMDAAFREAALKGPLWEEVSRKLGAMGYKRSAKKCREKFENVDKYYKRTKDGRAGRGDGKTYRFFTELEALHGGAGGGGGGGASSPHPPLVPATSLAPTPVAMAPPASSTFPSMVVSMAAPPMHHAEPPPVVVTMPPASTTAPPPAAVDVMMSFSSSSDDDGEDTDETGDGGGKRKRRGGDGSGSSSNKMMRFFEGLMRQVMERQEEMQQRFIEAIERREQDRMIREEAWRRQEVARLAREQDALAQERAMAASRDAAVVSFIQRITGQTIPMPPPPPTTTMIGTNLMKPTPFASAAPAPPPQPLQHHQPPPPSVHNQLAPKPQPPAVSSTTTTTTTTTTQQQQSQQPQATPQQPENKQEAGTVFRAPATEDTAAATAMGSPSPSRWPKAEVHALIQLRTELEARYQDSGPKGPLWEDISLGMRRMGYNRSAKRCKEKWENINKYFKKVKESNKKRPEDSKTCPYYHQLDALYRNKATMASPHPTRPAEVLAAVPLSQTAPPHQAVPGAAAANNNNNKQDCISSIGNGNGCATTKLVDNGGSSGGMQTQLGSNGTVTANKEDMMMTKETPTREEEMPQPVSMNDSYVNDRMDAGDDTDSMDDDDEDDFDDDDEEETHVGGGNHNNNTNNKSTMQYEIQFQRQQQSQPSVVVRPNASAGAGSGPGPATTSGSFLTMVHH